MGSRGAWCVERLDVNEPLLKTTGARLLEMPASETQLSVGPCSSQGAADSRDLLHLPFECSDRSVRLAGNPVGIELKRKIV